MHTSTDILKQIFIDVMFGSYLEIRYGVKITILVDCIGFPVAENIILDTKIKVSGCLESEK